MKKGSFLLFIGVLVLAIAVGYTGYLYWRDSDVAEQVVVVQQQVKTANEKMLERDNLKLVQAIAAKEIANDLRSTIVKWSRVIEQIRKTIPQKEGTSIVEVLSYSGSNNQDISVNVKTLPASEKAYFDVADLIKGFNNSPLFADSFVPSISSGLDEKGKEILSFALSTKYLGEKEPVTGEQKDLGPTLGEVLAPLSTDKQVDNEVDPSPELISR